MSPGSMAMASRAPGLVSRWTALAAFSSAVRVLPHAFGPSMTTAPIDANRASRTRSITRGRYLTANASLTWSASEQPTNRRSYPDTFCDFIWLQFSGSLRAF